VPISAVPFLAGAGGRGWLDGSITHFNSAATASGGATMASEDDSGRCRATWGLRAEIRLAMLPLRGTTMGGYFEHWCDWEEDSETHRRHLGETGAGKKARDGEKIPVPRYGEHVRECLKVGYLESVGSDAATRRKRRSVRDNRGTGLRGWAEDFRRRRWRRNLFRRACEDWERHRRIAGNFWRTVVGGGCRRSCARNRSAGRGRFQRSVYLPELGILWKDAWQLRKRRA